MGSSIPERKKMEQIEKMGGRESAKEIEFGLGFSQLMKKNDEVYGRGVN